MYWCEEFNHIKRADLDGSNIETLISPPNTEEPQAIALTDTKIYWVNDFNNTIKRADIDGSNVELLVTGLNKPVGIAIEGTKMYWTDQNNSKIQRADLDGSNVEDLVTTGLVFPHAITTTSSKMYWSDGGTDKIQRANLDGSGVEDLVTNIEFASGLAISGTKMYWTGNGSGGSEKIQRSDLDGNNVEDIITSGLNDPFGLYIHGLKMFWCDAAGGKVKKANLDGTNIEELVTGLNLPVSVAIPPFDDCSGVVPLTANTATPGDTNGATQSLAGCTGNADDDIWYTFTPANSENVTISVIPSGSDPIDDIVFQVYDGSCGSLNSLACVDVKIAGVSEHTTLALTASTQYFVRVYDFSGTAANEGEFDIDFISAPEPANNECANAVTLNSGSPSVNGDNRGGTQSLVGCTGDADDDVWYTFTASLNANATITVTPSGSVPIDDIVFQLYSGSCGSLTSVACIDAKIAGFAESTVQAVTAGTDYFVRVYDFDNEGMKRGEFTIDVSTNVFLPVELLNFIAKPINKNVQLTWQTATEINNHGFEIERSHDGRNWQKLGFVKGQGLSQTQLSYQYLDQFPRKGLNYYRLKQVDFDGAFEYSDVRSVEFTDSRFLISVSPNPTQSGEFTLYLPENEATAIQMTLYDYTGRTLRQSQIENLQANIKVSDMEKGIYLIRVDMDGRTAWERVVVNE